MSIGKEKKIIHLIFFEKQLCVFFTSIDSFYLFYAWKY